MPLRFSKWGERPHWAMDLRYLGSDDFGHWIGAPAGMPMARPGLSAVTTAACATLVPPGAGFVATFNGSGHDSCDLYVDISSVPVWDGTTVRAVDLDLDVIRRLDGSVFVDDEDEFAEHQELFGYPPEVVTAAQASCDAVHAAVLAGEEPWASVGARWVEVGARTCLPDGR